MHGLGLTPPETPSLLDPFMNIPWRSDGELSLEPPMTRSGDAVTFEVLLDAVVAFSACPQDILPINGTAGQPFEAHFRSVDPAVRQGGHEA